MRNSTINMLEGATNFQYDIDEMIQSNALERWTITASDPRAVWNYQTLKYVNMSNLPTTDSFKITIVSRGDWLWKRQISKLKTTAGFAQSVKRLTASCRAEGFGFDFRGRTITIQGLKIIEKWRYSFCTASSWTFSRLWWPRKMEVPSPVGDVKIVLNTVTRR